MTRASDDVLAERRRQIEVEQWTPDHDAEHASRELAAAAACYVLHYVQRSWLAEQSSTEASYAAEPVPDDWPWQDGDWKPKNPRRDLVRAAALILAELDRIDREAAST